jgi:periplasmic protein CpxP/Spy
MKRVVNRWLVSLALSGAAAFSFAQTPPTAGAPPSASQAAVPHEHGRRGPMHEHPFMHVLHQLNLTDAQKTQIHSIYKAARPQMESLAESTHQNMAELMSTSPQDAGYTALVEKSKADALAHIKLITDTQAQIYAVLTPEQQAKIPDIVAAEKARREAARQKRQPVPAQPAPQ